MTQKHTLRPFNRRDLIKSAALLAGGIGAMGPTNEAGEAGEITRIDRPEKCSPCLFTKPLHNRKVAELPAVLKELRVDAVDLTCRPEGHVLPERVADDLPKAVELLKSAGVRVPMVTTAITDANEGRAAEIIRTVGQLGIRYIKLGYYPYGDLRKIMPTIAEAQRKLTDVVALCRQHNVHAGYHTHCGKNIGGGLWDVWHLLGGKSARDVGIYFDLRHATVEGGEAGWEIAMNMMASRITMLALKDFVWKKDDKGQWKPDDVRLGAGMVRLDYGLEQLQQLGFAGPISLHVEYASGKTDVGSEQDKQNLENIARDWRTMNEALQRATLL